MPLVSRKRPAIGDVIEIPIPDGLAYAQYTHKHLKYGALLHVLPGVHHSPVNDFSGLVALLPQFVAFFPLGAACNRGIVRVVANEPIPFHAQAFPIFRSCVKTPNGCGPWWLWDGSREWKVGELEEEMKSLPLHEIVNDTLLIARIVQGWRHEFDT
ncbi:MAG: hypothetical protein PHH11_07365 [Methylomonas sp.]|nr:hypothetical protein [Methylomonas sp.]